MIPAFLALMLAMQAPEFEVASIHPSKDDGHHSSNGSNGFYRTHNLTLKRLIAFAYDVDVRQISGGPAWIDSDSFDIYAKIPEQYAKKRTREAVPEMLQSLLADRFQVALHREEVQLSGYALVVTKNGPKMKLSESTDGNSSTNEHNTHLVATNVTMANFAKSLSRDPDVGGLVADRTGLTGAYNFQMDWAPEKVLNSPDSKDDRPSIFVALVQQLGLKLESAKIPAQAIVVDRAEKPEGN